MIDNATQLAAVFKRAADEAGGIEKPFRQAVEKYLIELGAKLEIEMTPHTEVTMGTSGRADTVYNRLIVEWEAPDSLKATNSATKNRQTPDHAGTGLVDSIICCAEPISIRTMTTPFKNKSSFVAP
jgi:hypothetical protein